MTIIWIIFKLTELFYKNNIYFFYEPTGSAI